MSRIEEERKKWRLVAQESAALLSRGGTQVMCTSCGRALLSGLGEGSLPCHMPWCHAMRAADNMAASVLLELAGELSSGMHRREDETLEQVRERVRRWIADRA